MIIIIEVIWNSPPLGFWCGLFDMEIISVCVLKELKRLGTDIFSESSQISKHTYI